MRTKSAPDGTGLAQCDVFALPLAWHWMNCGLLSKRYLPEGPACATNVFSIRHNLLPIERCARVLLVDHLENLEVLQQHTDLRHCSFPILDHSVEKRLVFCCVGIPERVFSITKTGVGAKVLPSPADVRHTALCRAGVWLAVTPISFVAVDPRSPLDGHISNTWWRRAAEGAASGDISR